uniref:Uncharacterized protein n=1 Tax=Sinocyclocheilus anshuiensis TaxID=1608454 RepID=A0A671PFQ2_9TELE
SYSDKIIFGQGTKVIVNSSK